MAGPVFLMWYDDNPKVPLLKKIEDAIEAYTDRFAISPKVVLVNEAEVVQFERITVRGVGHIRRNNFWVGLEDVPEGLPQDIIVPA